MKNSYTFSLLIILSFYFLPLSSTQAALVPIKTSTKKSKKSTLKIKKRILQKEKQHYKYRLKKKHFPKPEQQNSYEEIFVFFLVIVLSYVAIAIALIILGFVFSLIGLWITGICLLAIPLLIFLVLCIQGSINNAKFRKLNRNSN